MILRLTQARAQKIRGGRTVAGHGAEGSLAG